MAPILDKQFRRPGVLAEGSALNFDHALEVTALKPADFNAQFLD